MIFQSEVLFHLCWLPFAVLASKCNVLFTEDAKDHFNITFPTLPQDRQRFDFNRIIIKTPQNISSILTCAEEHGPHIKPLLRYRNQKTSSWTRSSEWKSEIELDDIEPCQTYVFQVKAKVKQRGKSPISDKIKLGSKAIGPAPLSKAELVIEDENKVEISWQVGEKSICAESVILATENDDVIEIPVNVEQPNETMVMHALSCKKQLINLSVKYENMLGKPLSLPFDTLPSSIDIGAEIVTSDDGETVIQWQAEELKECSMTVLAYFQFYVRNILELVPRKVLEIRREYYDFGSDKIGLAEIEEEMHMANLIGPCQEYMLTFNITLQGEGNLKTSYEVLKEIVLHTNSSGSMSTGIMTDVLCKDENNEIRAGKAIEVQDIDSSFVFPEITLLTTTASAIRTIQTTTEAYANVSNSTLFQSAHNSLDEEVSKGLETMTIALIVGVVVAVFGMVILFGILATRKLVKQKETLDPIYKRPSINDLEFRRDSENTKMIPLNDESNSTKV